MEASVGTERDVACRGRLPDLRTREQPMVGADFGLGPCPRKNLREHVGAHLRLQRPDQPVEILVQLGAYIPLVRRQRSSVSAPADVHVEQAGKALRLHDRALQLVPPELTVGIDETGCEEDRHGDAEALEEWLALQDVVGIPVVERDGDPRTAASPARAERRDLGERYRLPEAEDALEMLLEVPGRHAQRPGIEGRLRQAVVAEDEAITVRS